MKEQYVGDINDFCKYGLLRMLADGGRIKIGVCWMLTPHDDRPHGKKIQYLDQPKKWYLCDPELFNLLKNVVNGVGSNRLAQIESSGILPGVVFQNHLLPDNSNARQSFMMMTREQFQDRDIVFFDPDIGIQAPTTKPRGWKDSSKYLYWDEITEMYNHGHSLLIYQHFPRRSREDFISQLCWKLARLLCPQEVWVFRASHVLFLMALRQEHVGFVDGKTLLAKRSACPFFTVHFRKYGAIRR